MILTLTLNPSIDLTYHLAEDAVGEVDVHRTTASTVEASGKGVNVSRDLRAGGVATTAILPLGGATGRHVADLLLADGVDCQGVPVESETRINTSILLPSGRTLKVNGPGSPLSPADLSRVLGCVEEALAGLADAGAGADSGALADSGAPADRWLVIAGSLPPGLDAETVAQVIRLAHSYDVPVAVDVSGPALRAALSAGADLLAPNEIELAELLGGANLEDAEAVAAAARSLATEHDVAFVVSMGKHGAVYVDSTLAVHGSGPELVPVNTAGAGDAFLAGWLAIPGEPAERMARALAWGRSACLCPTTVDPAPGSRGTDGIHVRELV